jgi:peptide-methionine (S)-S-oxide reductase
MPEIATFGAGCFWGIEAAFQQVPGVIDTAVGYGGGEMLNPTYKDVCTDETSNCSTSSGKCMTRHK